MSQLIEELPVTLDELAVGADVSRRSIQRAIKDGDISPVQVGSIRVFRRSELSSLLESIRQRKNRRNQALKQNRKVVA